MIDADLDEDQIGFRRNVGSQYSRLILEGRLRESKPAFLAFIREIFHNKVVVKKN